jgi:hypothetical protein
MRTSILIMAVLLTALLITACASRNQSQRLSEDESLRRKLVAEWQGTLAISTNEVASFKSVIRSDGSFSAQNKIYDTSSHLLRAAQWGGTYVVTNRAVVCTYTNCSEIGVSLPHKVPPEPIIRIDDHELVIFNENGQTVVLRKVLH